METTIIIAGAAAVVAAVLAYSLKKGNPIKGAVPQAIEAKDIKIISEAIGEAKLNDNANVWHKSLEELWSNYERELAAKLLLEASKVHESEVIRMWTQKIAEIEPELALQVLGRDFLIEKLELPEDAIPEPQKQPRQPRKGERQYKKKKVKKKKRLK